jgi:hypothetical protein
MRLDLEFARLIDATPEEVFDAFTDPEGQEASTARTTRAGSSSPPATCASAGCGPWSSDRRPASCTGTGTCSR